jgi:hypothetical protein
MEDNAEVDPDFNNYLPCSDTSDYRCKQSAAHCLHSKTREFNKCDTAKRNRTGAAAHVELLVASGVKSCLDHFD